MLRLLANTSDRIARKIAAQEQELKECANRERLKISGDLIQANLYQMEKGQSVLRVPNFYEEGLPLVDIVLYEARPLRKTRRSIIVNTASRIRRKRNCKN